MSIENDSQMSTENDSKMRTIERLPNENNRITPKHSSSPTQRNTCQIQHDRISSSSVIIVKMICFPRKIDLGCEIEPGFQNLGSQNLKMKLNPLNLTQNPSRSIFSDFAKNFHLD